MLKEGKAQVIRRINEDGTIKDEVITEDLGTIEILLEEGNNTLSIKNYDAEISAKWAIKVNIQKFMQLMWQWIVK